MKFDASSPQNKAAAAATQAIGDARAKAAAPSLMAFPPAGYPNINSIPAAKVLGYASETSTVVEVYDADGNLKLPGDKWFWEYQSHRLGWDKQHPQTIGWERRTRSANCLYCIVAGNPIMLESAARAAGYSRALAINPNTLQLGEIED